MKKLKVKVHHSTLLGVIKFAGMPIGRIRKIKKTKPQEVSGVFKINEKAAMLHPDFQKMIITKVTDHENAGAKTFELKRADGYKAANFRAGQYLSVLLKIGNSIVTRPYSISSSPSLAKEGKYTLTVRKTADGFASDYILSEWKVGDEVVISDPQGNFFYDNIRDPENIIAIAGGSGITPFLSMAAAIRDKAEDFNLTILYGSKTKDAILFEKELLEISEATSKVKVYNVLSDENIEGYEHGFINADIIKKYAPDGEYSIFICGPEAMYRFVDKEIATLSLPSKNVRREMLGVTKKVWEQPEYPAELKDKTFELTVKLGPDTYKVPMLAKEPILVAVEKAGIPSPSRCRSGECGWCRAKLVEGKIFATAENEYRRWADKNNNYIHPCSAFALSDCTIEISGTYIK